MLKFNILLLNQKTNDVFVDSVWMDKDTFMNIYEEALAKGQQLTSRRLTR